MFCKAFFRYVIGFLQDINQFSPDYVDIDQEEAFVDYKKRIAHYEETYEQICENSDSERCDFSSKFKLFGVLVKSTSLTNTFCLKN